MSITQDAPLVIRAAGHRSIPPACQCGWTTDYGHAQGSWRLRDLNRACPVIWHARAARQAAYPPAARRAS